MVARFFTLIFLLHINISLSAMDLNETTSIIDEANKATQTLQGEFDILVNEVAPPIRKEVPELNNTTPQLLTSSISVVESNDSIALMDTTPLLNEEVFELNKSIELNHTIPMIKQEVFEVNESIERNTSMSTPELNTSTKLSCKEKNSSLSVKELNISLDFNNSIADNGCTDTEIQGKSVRGLAIYKTKIKPYCKIAGDQFAKQYMQEDWDDIYHEKELKMEVIKACPKMEGQYKDKWTPHLYQFTLEYASDSDSIPEC